MYPCARITSPGRLSGPGDCSVTLILNINISCVNVTYAKTPFFPGLCVHSPWLLSYFCAHVYKFSPAECFKGHVTAVWSHFQNWLIKLL